MRLINRRQAREEAFIILFQQEFRDNLDEILDDFLANHEKIGEQENYIRRICERFISNKEKIDETIEKYSKNWKKDRISMVSLAILRLAICEMLYFDDIPVLVSISEALEVSKKFEGEEAIPFVNGILEGVRAELDEASLGGES